jgi:hypothetical protein
LLHKTDYGVCQAVGARLHREGHPGLLVPSVRRPQGENFVVFNPAVLSKPRANCQLTYWLDGERIRVEKAAGVAWLEVAVADL